MGVAVAPDGSLLVSDDGSGSILACSSTPANRPLRNNPFYIRIRPILEYTVAPADHKLADNNGDDTSGMTIIVIMI